MMEGNTLSDIAIALQTSYTSLQLRFRNAVYRIVRQNNRDWEDVILRKTGTCNGCAKN